MATHHHSIFTGQMLFLMPNQHCQSTEGNRNIIRTKHKKKKKKKKDKNNYNYVIYLKFLQYIMIQNSHSP